MTTEQDEQRLAALKDGRYRDAEIMPSTGSPELNIPFLLRLLAERDQRIARLEGALGAMRTSIEAINPWINSRENMAECIEVGLRHYHQAALSPAGTATTASSEKKLSVEGRC